MPTGLVHYLSLSLARVAFSDGDRLADFPLPGRPIKTCKESESEEEEKKCKCIVHYTGGGRYQLAEWLLSSLEIMAIMVLIIVSALGTQMRDET